MIKTRNASSVQSDSGSALYYLWCGGGKTYSMDADFMVQEIVKNFGTLVINNL